MTSQELQMLESAMQRRLANMPKRLRPFTTDHTELPRTVLLTGARGCGKSTFLLHNKGDKRMLYVSVDNPIIVSRPIYELVSEIFMMGYEGVILDEIHYAANWSLHLKALHDDFPDKKIWVSDSSALVLRSSVGDLSRRYVSIRMPLMSFREYLYLETGENYPVYHLGDKDNPAVPDSRLLKLFNDYRHHGSRPFYQEGNFNTRYMGVLSKVLDTDIPFFLPNITDNNLRLMRAVVGTLATSSIPRVQVSSLCADWNIGAQKLYQLLYVMESVDLLRIVRYPNDTKANSVGAKMLFYDPCAYSVLNADVGTEREAFVANCFSNAGYDVYASKDEKSGDFIITNTTDNMAAKKTLIEVGGVNKKPKNSDFVVRDGIDYPSSNVIPFWMLAMMW